MQYFGFDYDVGKVILIDDLIAPMGKVSNVSWDKLVVANGYLFVQGTFENQYRKDSVIAMLGHNLVTKGSADTDSPEEEAVLSLEQVAFLKLLMMDADKDKMKQFLDRVLDGVTVGKQHDGFWTFRISDQIFHTGDVLMELGF
jgi:hypothetical protein